VLLSVAMDVTEVSLPLVAAAVGSSWQLVQKIVAGERGLTADHIVAICQHLPHVGAELVVLLVGKLDRGLQVIVGDRILAQAEATAMPSIVRIYAAAMRLSPVERQVLCRRMLEEK